MYIYYVYIYTQRKPCAMFGEIPKVNSNTQEQTLAAPSNLSRGTAPAITLLCSISVLEHEMRYYT